MPRWSYPKRLALATLPTSMLHAVVRHASANVRLVLWPHRPRPPQQGSPPPPRVDCTPVARMDREATHKATRIHRRATCTCASPSGVSGELRRSDKSTADLVSASQLHPEAYRPITTPCSALFSTTVRTGSFSAIAAAACFRSPGTGGALGDAGIAGENAKSPQSWKSSGAGSRQK